MKTIVALSDIHYQHIPENLKNIIAESDYFFFLGDGVQNLDDTLFHKELHAVKGNCDAVSFPREEIVEVEGLRILLTHGDLYGVKRGLLALKLRAEELACDVVFYGHTHDCRIDEIDDVTLINPGALYSPFNFSPSYCYAVVNNKKITAKIVELT